MNARSVCLALGGVACGAGLFGCTFLFPVDDLDRGGNDAATNDAEPREGGTTDDGGSDYASEVLTDAPLAYWRFDETSGTTAKDAAGTHDGTYQNVTLGGPSAIGTGSSATFTTPNSAVVVGNVLDIVGGASFSLEAWAFATSVDQNYERIVTKRDDTAPVEGWSLTNSTKNFTLDAYTDGNFAGGVASHFLTANQWWHVVVTYDRSATKLTFYLNGTQDSQSTTTVSMKGSTANLVLGSLSSANGNAWRGNLDEIAIYDHALAPDRVAAHYHAAGR
ncbi:MAG TPA: LamG domain-containing protein [Polyangiaceae bacterium]